MITSNILRTNFRKFNKKYTSKYLGFPWEIPIVADIVMEDLIEKCLSRLYVALKSLIKYIDDLFLTSGLCGGKTNVEC